ncbi:hypothetical protein SUDANB21_02079 [Streptomyces sp. enrichment culture]|uniref:hypothetical protein n=1 Tax=Streptomyces althioticus TaxID=83380 RepID=UPI0036BEBAA9
MLSLVSAAVRRQTKRNRHAREQRALEAFAFQHAPASYWQRIAALNAAARIWRRRPERPRKDNRHA